jgi:hypothetical protein
MQIWGLLLAGLLGLGMTVCGGGFTVLALLAMLDPGKVAGLFPLALIVSVPSLLLGVLFIVLVWREWQYVRKTGQN